MGAIEGARAVGADCAQIWGSNPRAWAPPDTPAAAARAFGEAWRSAGLGPLVLHCPYMVNVASPNAEFRRRSVRLAKATVALAEEIGAHGVVVHSGAAGASTPRPDALGTAADSFTRIADAASETLVLIELMAGTTGAVASTLLEARELFEACGMHERLAVAVDTCHLMRKAAIHCHDVGMRHRQQAPWAAHGNSIRPAARSSQTAWASGCSRG